MAKLPSIVRKLSARTKKEKPDTTWLTDASWDQHTLRSRGGSFGYSLEKPREKAPTSRFGFAPEPIQENSLDAVLASSNLEEAEEEDYSRDPTLYNFDPYSRRRDSDTFDTYASIVPRDLGRRKSNTLKRSDSTMSRRSSFFVFEGKRGSSSAMLCDAAAEGDVAQIGRLIGAGAKPGKSSRERDGASPVHFASSGGHLAALKSLVMHGAKLDAIDAEGRTALHLAVIGGHNDLFGFLVGNGCKADAMDCHGFTAMQYAKRRSSYGLEDVVEEEDDDVRNRLRFSINFAEMGDMANKRASRGSQLSSGSTRRKRRSVEEALRMAAESGGYKL